MALKRSEPSPERDRVVVAYCRVSSREQAEGYSIEAQLRLCQELVTREGLQLVRDPFVEVHSAKEEGRPVFKEMLAFLRKNPRIGGIVAHKIDRLGRNLGDLAQLFEELKLRPWLVDQAFPDNAQGRLAYNMLGVFAKYYSDNLREEVRKGQAEKARQGGTPFHAPHGYVHRPETGEVPALDSERRAALLQIFDDAATGNFTIDAIQDRAWRRGYRFSEKQARIPRSTLERILKNPYYAGEIHFRGNIHLGSTRRSSPASSSSAFSAPSSERPAAMASPRSPTADSSAARAAGRSPRRRSSRRRTASRRAGTSITAAPATRTAEASGSSSPSLRTPSRTHWRRSADFVAEVREAIVLSKGQEVDFRERAIKDLERQAREVRAQLDALLLEKVNRTISDEEFVRVRALLRSKEGDALIALEAHRKAGGASLDLAERAFELANSAPDRWMREDPPSRERLLKMLRLNFVLDGATLRPEWRRPFDLFLERPSHPIRSGWWDRFRTAASEGQLAPNLELAAFEVC